jgi:hypothetical protein
MIEEVNGQEPTIQEILDNGPFGIMPQAGTANGTATETQNYAVGVGGGAEVAGTADESFSDVIEPEGGAEAAGSLALTSVWQPTASGGAELNGTSAPDKVTTLQTSGGAELNGTATVTFTDFVDTSGGIELAGAADVNTEGTYNETMSGGMEVAGVAKHTHWIAEAIVDPPPMGLIIPPIPSQKNRKPGCRANKLSPQYKGLVGWWPMEGTGKIVPDPVGGNNGLITSGDPDNMWITDSDRGGHVLALDGDNEYVEMGSITSGHPLMLNGSDVTISAWFYQESGGDTYQRIVDKSTAGSGIGGYCLWAHPTDRTVNLSVNNISYGGTYAAQSNQYEFSKWHHLVGVITASYFALYVDGVEVTASSTGGYSQPTETTANLRIGTWYNADAREWKGRLDDIRIYNRVLTPQEIQALWNPQTRYELWLQEALEAPILQDVYKGVEVAGSADVTLTDIVEVGGGAEAAGSATVTFNDIFAPSGGVELAGLSDVTANNIYEETMSGGAELAGTADESFSDVIEVSGGVEAAGSLVLNSIWQPTASGGAELAGSATVDKLTELTIGGGAETAGSVDESFVFNPETNGKHNLVRNGDGSEGDNSNFTSFTYDAEDHPWNTEGSFLNDGGYINTNSVDLIKVNVDHTYDISAVCKGSDGTSGDYDPANKQYAGIRPFDIDGNYIDAYYVQRYPGSALTTLAAQLNPGDSTMQLTDASGWYNATSNYRNFCWWPYTNAQGYTYPDWTYSRNFSGTNAWPAGGISGNVVTLTSTWSGNILPAGTPVKNVYSAYGSYTYCIKVGTAATEDVWTKETYGSGKLKKQVSDTDGVASFNEFRYGTEYVRINFLCNYPSTTPMATRWADIKLEYTPSRLAGGESTLSHITEYAVSGGAELAGEAATFITRQPGVSGGAELNGSHIQTFIDYVDGTGGVELAGEAFVTVEGSYDEEMQGGIEVAGSADEDFTDQFIASGGAELNGAATHTQTSEPVSTGGAMLPLQYTADVELIINHTASGGAEVAGDPDTDFTYEHTVSGNAELSGSAVEAVTYNLDTSGGAELNGTADEDFNDVFVPSGGVELNGTIELDSVWQPSVDGNAEAAGSAVISHVQAQTVGGGAELNGAASIWANYGEGAEGVQEGGGTELAGTASVTFIDYVDGSGGAEVAGAADVLLEGTYNETMSGGVEAAGVAGNTAYMGPGEQIPRLGLVIDVGPAQPNRKPSCRPNTLSNQYKGLGFWFPGIPADSKVFYDPIGGSHGSTTQDIDVTWVVDPERGHVVNLDGLSSSYIDFGSGEGHHITGDEITISHWIYLHNLPSSGNMYPINREGEYEIGIPSNGNIWWALGSVSWAANSTGYILPTNQWVLLTLTYDGDRVRLYANGVLEYTSGALSGNIGDAHVGQDSLWIGGREGTSFTYFDGLIDDVRVYNRALSSAEAQALWNPQTRYELWYEPEHHVPLVTDTATGVEVAGSAKITTSDIVEVGGGLEAAGTATEDTTYNPLLSGGVEVAGAAVQEFIPAFEVEGGVIVGGSADESFSDVIEIGGGVELAGIATVNKATAELEVGGGAEVAGEATESFVYDLEGSGGVEVAGAATLKKVIDETASGGVEIAGSATENTVKLPSISGGAELAGSADEDFNDQFIASGGVEIAGEALETVEGSYDEEMQGGIEVAGAAKQTFIDQFIASGGAEAAGTATVNKLTELTIGGGAEAAGTVDYNAIFNQDTLEPQNIVPNARGEEGDDTNFTFCSYEAAEPNQPYGVVGVFKNDVPGTYNSASSNSYLAVNEDHHYDTKVIIKGGDGDGTNFNADNYQYVGVSCFDGSQRFINHEHVSRFGGAGGSALTTLAAPLNTNDTTMQLNDTSGWCNSGAWYQKAFTWWPFEDYETYTYSRNTSLYKYGSGTPNWADGGISGNVITLSGPWPGPDLPSGTPVKNSSSGGTYNYCTFAGAITEDWVGHTGYIEGIEDKTSWNGSSFQFRPGTEYIRVLFLINYTANEISVRYADLRITYEPSPFAGGESYRSKITEVPTSGGVELGGSADESFSDVIETEGGVEVAGVATNTQEQETEASGGAEANGAADVDVVYSPQASGGLELAGESPTSFHFNHTYIKFSAFPIPMPKAQPNRKPSSQINRDSEQANGLVAWWGGSEAGGKFLYDKAHGATGTLTNIEPDDDWITDSDRGGHVLTLDGNNEYVEIGSITSGHPLMLNGSDVTISAWFYQESGGDTFQRIIDKSTTGSGTGGYCLWAHPTDRTVGLSCNGISYGGTYDTQSNQYEFSKWHHLVGIITASYFALYVDGVEVTAVSTGGYSQPTETTANLRIGTWYNADAREWKGRLDDIRIYDRALTSQEVQEIYNPQTRYELWKEPEITAFAPLPYEQADGVEASGTADVDVTYSLQTSGGVEAAGDADAAVTYDPGTSGGVEVAGDAEYTSGNDIIAEGGVELAGSADEDFNDIFVPSGGVELAGAADEELADVVEVGGGVEIAGTAEHTLNSANVATGGVELAGLAAETLYSTNVATGGAEVAGQADLSEANYETGSGGVELSGEADFANTWQPTVTGGAEVAGSADEDFNDQFIASGGAEVAGEAFVEVEGSYDEEMDGGVEVSGAAKQTFNDQFIASGGTEAAGSVEVDVIYAADTDGGANLGRAKYARPDSDTDSGFWATTPLWSKIDEASPDDEYVVQYFADYSNDFEVTLSDITGSSDPHFLNYKIYIAIGASLTITLLDGTNEIASQTHSNLDATATYSYDLSQSEIGNISDYSNLSLNFDGTGYNQAPIPPSQIRVYWAELKVAGEEAEIEAIYNPTASGGAEVAGESDESFSDVIEVGGGVEVAGEAVDQHVLNNQGSGGTEVAGSADETVVYNPQASGGAEVAGEAVDTHNQDNESTGGTEVAGSATRTVIYNHVPTAQETAFPIPMPRAQPNRKPATEVNTLSQQYKGLVAWWPGSLAGGEHLYDRIDGNLGTLSGRDPEDIWVIDGERGRHVMDFDGTNDMVTAGDGDMGITSGDFTVAGWMRPTTQDDHEEHGIFTNSLFSIYNRGFSNTGYYDLLVRIEENVSLGSSSWTYWAGCRSSNEIALNEWTHVVGVKDGDTLRIYFNGVLEDERVDVLSGYTVDYANASTIRIGRGAWWTTAKHTGQLDDVRVYKRALNAQEIQTLYNPQTRYELWKEPEIVTVVHVIDSIGVKAGGEAVVEATQVALAGGGVEVAGDADWLFAPTIHPEGGVEVAGTTSQVYEEVMTGGAEVAGTAELSETNTEVATGGVEVAGSADEDFSDIFEPSGGVEAAGTAGLYILYNPTATGGAEVAGEADNTIIDNAEMSGGVEVSGAADRAFIYNPTATGGAEVAGETEPSEINTEVGSGGVEANGTAQPLVTYNPIATGGAEVAGETDPSKTSTEVASGGVEVAGTADEDFNDIFVPSGGVELGGSARETFYDYVEVGGGIETAGDGDDWAIYNPDLRTYRECGMAGAGTNA